MTPGTDNKASHPPLDEIRALLERGERDARLLDGHGFDSTPWVEAYALLDAIDRVAERALAPWLAAILALVEDEVSRG